MDAVDDEAAFQFCLDLADFPLFPDELHRVAKKTREVLTEFGVPCPVDLCEVTQAFFADSGDGVLSERLHEEVLCDSFWQTPCTFRPNLSEEWIVVKCPLQGLQLDKSCCKRVVLDETWRMGDWPPGCCVPPTELHLLYSNAALCLRHLLDGLTSNWGWLRAPQSFWGNAISTPFLRFHPAS